MRDHVTSCGECSSVRAPELLRIAHLWLTLSRHLGYQQRFIKPEYLETIRCKIESLSQIIETRVKADDSTYTRI